MTKDDIIRMAREANCEETFGTDTFLCTVVDLERFATLVAAAQREADAKLIEAYPYWLGTVAKKEIAAAIRRTT